MTTTRPATPVRRGRSAPRVRRKEIEHGTYTGYKAGCGGSECLAANRRYNRRRERLIAYGQWEPFVDAEPVRARLKALGAAGLGWVRIAALAGVPRGTVSHLLYGAKGRKRGERVRSDTAVALLAVRADLDTLDARAVVDASGTRRRIQAMCWLGYSLDAQAQRLGRRLSSYGASLRCERVTAGTARAVRRLYDELWLTPAPDGPGVTAARRSARRKGWLSPLAWDDDLIDLPAVELEVELARRVALMDDQELLRCRNARYKGADPSPLMEAGAREWSRRKAARGCEAVSA